MRCGQHAMWHGHMCACPIMAFQIQQSPLFMLSLLPPASGALRFAPRMFLTFVWAFGILDAMGGFGTRDDLGSKRVPRGAEYGGVGLWDIMMNVWGGGDG